MNCPADGFPRIILLGNGVGESCLIGLNQSDWAVVDSFCLSDGTPAAIQWLRDNGYPLESVKIIILSHWHTDHIKGADVLAESSLNAEILIPQSFTSKLMSYALQIFPDKYKKISGPLEAFKKIVQDPGNSRRIKTGCVNLFPYWGNDAKIMCLSPSNNVPAIDQKILSMLKNGSIDLDILDKLMRTNLGCIALWISYAQLGARVLSGADLEIPDWKLILERSARPELSGVNSDVCEKAHLYKVAHHGSVSGHYDPAYQDFFSRNRTKAILTPKRGGKNSPPTVDDLKRLKRDFLETWITVYGEEEFNYTQRFGDPGHFKQKPYDKNTYAYLGQNWGHNSVYSSANGFNGVCATWKPDKNCFDIEPISKLSNSARL